MIDPRIHASDTVVIAISTQSPTAPVSLKGSQMPTRDQRIRPAPSYLPGHLLHRIVILLLIAFAAFLSIHHKNKAIGSGPNVVLILTDDQGYGDLGCHGNKVIQTPALDRLSAESVRLTDYHVDPSSELPAIGRPSSANGIWATTTLCGRKIRGSTKC